MFKFLDLVQKEFDSLAKLNLTGEPAILVRPQLSEPIAYVHIAQAAGAVFQVGLEMKDGAAEAGKKQRGDFSFEISPLAIRFFEDLVRRPDHSWL